MMMAFISYCHVLLPAYGGSYAAAARYAASASAVAAALHAPARAP